MENLNFEKTNYQRKSIEDDIREKEGWILELKNKRGSYFDEIRRLSENEVDNETKKLELKVSLWRDLLSFLDRFKNSGIKNFFEWIDTLSQDDYTRFGNVKSDYGDEKTLKLFGESYGKIND